MLVGVVSDTHNNIKNIKKIICLFNEEKVDLVIHTGDISKASTLEIFSKLNSPLLGVFGNNDRIEKGLEKVNVETAWRDLMGNGVNSYTSNIKLHHNTLYVELSSSVLREELSYGKEKIIKMINDSLGKIIIHKLVLR